MPKRISIKVVVATVESIVSPDFTPSPLRQIVAKALRENHEFGQDVSEEYADKHFEEIREEIQKREFDAANNYFGYFYHIKINELNSDYVQGACFVQKNDPPDIAKSPCRKSWISCDAPDKDHDGCGVEKCGCRFDGGFDVLP